MRTGTLRTTGLTTAALTAAVLLGACGSSAVDGDSPSTTGDAAAVASVDGTDGTGDTDGADSPDPTSGASTGASGDSGTSDSSDRCATDGLTVTVGAPDGAAGSVYRTLSFENSSDRDCTLAGYPGVSLVTGDDQVGEAAERESSADGTPSVRLAPGESATADLKISNPGVYGDRCTGTPADGLRIYPPEDTASTVVTVDGLVGCTGDGAPAILRISPVRG